MSTGRNSKGRFTTGNTYGQGRKRGAALRYSQYRKLAQPFMPKIIEKLCELAQKGDVHAAKVILDRVWPPAVEELVALEAMIIELEARLSELQNEDTE